MGRRGRAGKSRRKRHTVSQKQYVRARIWRGHAGAAVTEMARVMSALSRYGSRRSDRRRRGCAASANRQRPRQADERWPDPGPCRRLPAARAFEPENGSNTASSLSSGTPGPRSHHVDPHRIAIAAHGQLRRAAELDGVVHQIGQDAVQCVRTRHDGAARILLDRHSLAGVLVVIPRLSTNDPRSIRDAFSPSPLAVRA